MLRFTAGVAQVGVMELARVPCVYMDKGILANRVTVKSQHGGGALLRNSPTKLVTNRSSDKRLPTLPYDPRNENGHVAHFYGHFRYLSHRTHDYKSLLSDMHPVCSGLLSIAYFCVNRVRSVNEPGRSMNANPVLFIFCPTTFLPNLPFFVTCRIFGIDRGVGRCFHQ